MGSQKEVTMYLETVSFCWCTLTYKIGQRIHFELVDSDGLYLFDFGVLLMRRDSSDNHQCFGIFIWEPTWKPATLGIALGNRWACLSWGFQDFVIKADIRDLSGVGLIHQAILNAFHLFNY